jgi:hypothetical protein
VTIIGEFTVGPIFLLVNKYIQVMGCVRATLSLAQGVEPSGGIRSINICTRIQEQKYYTPSGGIRREERMGIPMLGETLYTN